jgi:Spy/CpxP family protein refolding chaperone
MKTKLVAAFFAVAFTVTGLFAGAAYAFGDKFEGSMINAMKEGRFGRGPWRGMFRDRIARELNLTPEQKAQIEQIIESEKPNVRPLVLQLAEHRKQLKALGQDGNFNEAQVRAIAQQQGQTMTELIVIKERTQSRIFAVLTPEQREKAAQMRERVEQRFKEHMAENGFNPEKQ